MPTHKNSFLASTGDRTINGWVTQAQAQAPAFGEPFKFGTDLRFTRKLPSYLTELQLRSLAYLDPAAAAVQASLRNPKAAPVVHARIVRHGSLDGSGFRSAGGPVPPRQQPLAGPGPPPPQRRRRRHSFHADSQNVPPFAAAAIATRTGATEAAAPSELYATHLAAISAPPPPPKGATVSRAPVVMAHGGRVTKATGMVLREWGALYPQAWVAAPAGGTSGPALLHSFTRNLTGALPTETVLDSLKVVERQDAADWRRAAAAGATVVGGDAMPSRRRQTKSHPDGCRCPACTSLVAMYYTDSEDGSEEETPGPGQYDVTAAAAGTVGRGGPAYTIRGRTAPPPAAAWVNPEAAKVPGPGAYNPSRPATEGPAYTFKSRPRGPSTLPDDMPGPGDYYDPNKTTVRDGPAFTLAGKAKRKFETDGPGPGAYIVQGSNKEGPAITIAGRPRPRAPEPTPGPVDYQQDRALSPGRDGPAYTIGGRLVPKTDTDVPAPGDYDLPTVWRTGPAVSFAGKPVPKPEPEPSPGPGQYHVPPRPGEGLPAFTFGARPLESLIPEDLPGPGAYHIPAGSEGPAFTIASRPASPGLGQRDDELQPGPGAYNPESGPGSPSGPAYTFGARPQERSPPPSPGPGTYRAEESHAAILPGGNGPAYTLGSRPLPKELPDVPGPGTYQPSDPTLSPGPAFSMAGRPVERDPRDDIPAPGEYDTGILRPSDGPSYTIRSRPVEEKRPVSPGPGEYTFPARCAGPAFTMGSRPASPGAPASPDAIQDIPGPGTYDTVPQSPIGPSYTMRGRREERSPPPSPGPGDYSQPSVPSGPAFSIRGKAVEPEPPVSFVGPGAYDPEKPLPEAPAYTLQGRPREPERLQSPGPGEYDTYGGQADVVSGPAWTMRGRPADDPRVADGPAPGSYDLPASPRGPAYTLRSRPADLSRERPGSPGPGPGEYAAPSSPTGPSYSFRGRSAPREAPDSPGPAEYQTLSASPSGPAFTIKGRHADGPPADLDAPGPGTYGIPNPEALGRSGPAYSFRTRPSTRTDEGAPGPGEYGSTAAGLSGPAYTMAGRNASPATAEVPGPGTYLPTRDPDGPSFSIAPRVSSPVPVPTPAPGDYGTPDRGPSGPAWSLSQRLPEPTAEGPGPGEYYSPPSANGPAFTMGAKLKSRRRKKRRDMEPELGHYWSPPNPSGPAWSMGTRLQGPTPYKPEAGPGDYNDGRDLHTGPAWTLRPRTVPPSADPVPGPGTYNDSKLFPNPLGTVVSGPRPHTGRDPVYLTDLGGPYDETIKPARQPSRPSRKVTFHHDTLFRDSTDVTYGGRVRLEESRVSGPGGAAVSPPLARIFAGVPATAVMPQVSNPSPRSSQPAMKGTSVAGVPVQRSTSQERQQQQQQQQQQQLLQQRPQGGSRKGVAAAVAVSGADPRDTEVERAMQMYRRVALEQRYLSAGGGGAGGKPSTAAATVTTAKNPTGQPSQHQQKPLPLPSQQQQQQQTQWTAAAEGRTALGLGGPPTMTQGPMGLPVPQARRRLELAGVPGGPSTVGLSPRDAALARAAAYMSGRGASGLRPAGSGEAGMGRGQGPSAFSAGGGGGGGNAVTAFAGQERARPASIGVQATPEHAPRVMSAPAGSVNAQGARPTSKGRSGRGPSGNRP